MNWTEKQHGNIKIYHNKTLKHITLVRGKGYDAQNMILSYKDFNELKQLMEEMEESRG